MEKKLLPKPAAKPVIKPSAAIAKPKPLPPPPKGGEWSTFQKDVFADIATGEGHTVVEAYAGSAKTTTLVGGLSMVSTREKTFFSAFNKRIVEELKERVPWTVEVNTLHSYGFRAIKERYGSDIRPSNKRVRGMLDEMCDSDIPYEMRGQIAKLVSLAKNTLAETEADLDKLIDDFFLMIMGPQRKNCINLALEVMSRCKLEVDTGEIDFDDMIWLPVVKKLSLPKYDRVFVDEAQDLNAAQVALVMNAVKDSGRFTAVGDPRQAIYMFRGADSASIDNIRKHFNAKTLPLPICYRCPIAVVELAQEVVPGIMPAPGAPQGVVGAISNNEMYESAEPGDFILSRANAPLLRHALTLISDNKRAIIYGRDIGSMLMAFVRRSKETTVNGLLEYAEGWLDTERERLLSRIPPLKTQFRNACDTVRCIEVLAATCDTVQEVLEKIDRVFTDADDKNSIVLSTVHKAKGLESNRVFVLVNTFRHRHEYWAAFARNRDKWWVEARVRENSTPEELNIWYVAITRARSELMLVNSTHGRTLTLFDDEE